MFLLRITINTGRNLLVLNFEAVEFDYSLSNDKMPPLAQVNTYADNPLRKHAYPHVRANRMRVAGATNAKIVYHEAEAPPRVYYNNKPRAEQVPHSAQVLSRRTMAQARRIQSMTDLTQRPGTSPVPFSHLHTSAARGGSVRKSERTSTSGGDAKSVKTVSMKSRPPTSPHKNTKRSQSAANVRAARTHAQSLGTQSVVSVSGFQIGRQAGADDDSSLVSEEEAERRRRVSWAFEQPPLPLGTHMGLTETKTLLRSQMRSHADGVPPDFVYLSVNAIHASMKPQEASKNMESNRRQQELDGMKRQGRPNSSPSRLDPRTKVAIEQLGWDDLLMEAGLPPTHSDAKSESKMTHSSRASAKSRRTTALQVLEQVEQLDPPTTHIVTEFAVQPVDVTPTISLFKENVKTSIPRPYIIRPHSSTVFRDAPPLNKVVGDSRPKSAAPLQSQTEAFSRPSTSVTRHSRVTSAATRRRPGTAQTQISRASSTRMTSDSQADGRQKRGALTSSSPEPSIVPMLMQTAEVKAHIAKLKHVRHERRQTKLAVLESFHNTTTRTTCPADDPLRAHVHFRLQTHEQTQAHLQEVSETLLNSEFAAKQKKELYRQQRASWLAKIRGDQRKGKLNRCRSFAPEINELENPDHHHHVAFAAQA